MDDAPKLDTRSYDDVVAQTEALATAYTSGAWRPSRDLDLGGALIRLFGTMVGHAIRQLNKVPDKHRRAFTGLLGAVRIAPRAARAAITFQLDDGTRTATVPAGAQIAGAGDVPLVFETEQELALTRARLEAVFVLDVPRERYADRTPRALGLDPRPWDALGAPLPPPLEPDPASRPIEHEVYVAFDSIGVLGATTAIVDATAVRLPAEAVQWAAFRDGAWVDLPPVAATTSQWRLSADAGLVGEVEVAGVSARWLRGTFPAWLPAMMRLSATIAVAVADIPLQTAFVNGQPADFTRDVLPFGERPRVGDVFYLASDDAFAIAGATVVLSVTLTTAGDPKDSVRLEWEAWDGQRATPLGTSTQDSTGQAPFVDDTKAFTTNGTVTLRLGDAIPRSTVHGITSRWVRVRIAGGNYGKDMAVTVGADNAIAIVPATWHPPAIASAVLSWSGTIPATPQRLVRRTASNDEDLSAEAGGASWLYQALVDQAPSLHLGFDRAFEPALTTLYLQVVPPPPPPPTDYAQPLPPRVLPELVWAYWNGAAWTELAVEDGTRGFARSGLVRFLPPADAQPLPHFGHTLHWLRVRPRLPGFAPIPRLGRIATNTVFAAHAHTTTNEVLGGSNGARDQVFTLSQRPVLEGQRIEVGEPQPPPPAELARLEANSGADALTVEHPPDRPPVYWVRWTAVPDFWTSGPRDRHYTVAAATGQITFGNGTHGMIPPLGDQNVRAAWYRSGGGAAGNVAAGVLAQLKTTVPVTRGVSNHEPAFGGADLESAAAMMDRASRGIRHGGRAVTAEDYVDLALEASTAVARAVALTPSFVPVDQGVAPDTRPEALQRAGRVIVVVVPTALEPGEMPTADALAEIEDYLCARSAPGARIDVTGPSWVAVDITVRVVAESLSATDALLAQVRDAIARLLDPITGGAGAGWPFGRRPRASDLLACIAPIPGFDHATSIEVRCEAPFDQDDLSPEADGISVDELSLYGRLLTYARTITVTYPLPEPT